MNAAVHFDHQRGLVTVKIDDKGFYDLLAAKMDPLQTTGPQPRPQFALGGGHFVVHFYGTLEFGGCNCLLGNEAFGGHRPIPPAKYSGIFDRPLP